MRWIVGIFCLILVVAFTMLTHHPLNKTEKKEATSYPEDYNYAPILEDPAISKSLVDLAGTQNVAFIRENLGVRRPIESHPPYTVLAGNKPHMGSSESAMLWVDRDVKRVIAVLLHNGTVTIFYPQGFDKNTLPPLFHERVKDIAVMIGHTYPIFWQEGAHKEQPSWVPPEPAREGAPQAIPEPLDSD